MLPVRHARRSCQFRKEPEVVCRGLGGDRDEKGDKKAEARLEENVMVFFPLTYVRFCGVCPVRFFQCHLRLNPGNLD